MKVKFGPAKTAAYSEVSQPNPLRWHILYKDADGVFQYQTAEFKCKDYLNDLVAKVTGNFNLHVYGMDNSQMKINEEGVYLKLSNIQKMQQWKDNVEKCINPKLKEDLGVEVTITPQAGSFAIVLVPKECLENTYIISLLAWALRISNYGIEFSDWKDLVARSRETSDGSFRPFARAYPLVEKWGFKVAPSLKKYWFYMYDKLNSEVRESYANQFSYVHNCGVGNWAYLEKTLGAA